MARNLRVKSVEQSIQETDEPGHRLKRNLRTWDLIVFGVGVTLAKAIGFVLGTTTAYLINRRWTFNAAPSRARFFAVVALYGVTFAVQVGIYTWLYQVLPDGFWYANVAFVVAQGTATVINFLVQRFVIFKIR